jgi:hypothetical protein
MPLDYNAATYPGTAGAPADGLGIDRKAVAAAVERYLVSRGVAGQSCSCESQPASKASASVDAVDRFLARRGSASPGGYG